MTNHGIFPKLYGIIFGNNSNRGVNCCVNDIHKETIVQARPLVVYVNAQLTFATSIFYCCISSMSLFYRDIMVFLLLIIYHPDFCLLNAESIKTIAVMYIHASNRIDKVTIYLHMCANIHVSSNNLTYISNKMVSPVVF